MFTNIIQKLSLFIVAATMINAVSTALAQQTEVPEKKVSPATDKPADESKQAAEEKKVVRYPFHGTLSAVDLKAKTITLAGKEKKRIILIGKKTKIRKHGKPAELHDAVVGEKVGGLVTKNEEGEEEAVSLRFGPKPGKDSPNKLQLSPEETKDEQEETRQEASEEDAAETEAEQTGN